MKKKPSNGRGLGPGRFRGKDVLERKQRPGYDVHAPLSPEEFADLREFAAQFGDDLVLDKPMARFRHLKRLEELGFIGRDDDGSLYVAPFGKMRIAQEH